MDKDVSGCGSCQYFRDLGKMRPATIDPDVKGFWCSNSKSPFFMRVVGVGDVCGEFYRRGEKAPLVMRGAIQMTRLVRKAMRGRKAS